MKAWGLLGGTFDPVHFGHLMLAEAALETFGLERVTFMPAGQPPHKSDAVVAAARDRFNMVRAATADNPRFTVSQLELERAGPSYTVDTLRRLLETRPDIAWHLIVGGDALAEIPTWHQYEAILNQAPVLAAARPGVPLSLPEALKPWEGRIRLFSPPGFDVSSTLIRDRLAKGLSVRYLVPASVAAYISRHGLYQYSRGRSTGE